MNSPFIRVKLVSRCDPKVWLRQLPAGNPVWGNCKFIFAPDERSYDWLVVYDELPKKQDGVGHSGNETISCSPKNTLLITTEPSSIKYYNSAYTRQFGWILTSQVKWALPHPGRIYSQPGLRWFYGAHESLNIDYLRNHIPSNKTETISTVTSSKKQRHTLHYRRYHFFLELKKLIPELKVFGKGIRPILDKATALDPFKYHITAENFQGQHHWTEKLADVFLAASLPFYAGCSNLEEYFSPKSYIRININDVRGSVKIIKNAIKVGEYEKRLPYILDARQKVIDEYSLFAVLSREIEKRHTLEKAPISPHKIYRRKALRKNPMVAFQDIYMRSTLRLRHKLNNKILT